MLEHIENGRLDAEQYAYFESYFARQCALEEFAHEGGPEGLANRSDGFAPVIVTDGGEKTMKIIHCPYETVLEVKADGTFRVHPDYLPVESVKDILDVVRDTVLDDFNLSVFANEWSMHRDCAELIRDLVRTYGTDGVLAVPYGQRYSDHGGTEIGMIESVSFRDGEAAFTVLQDRGDRMVSRMSGKVDDGVDIMQLGQVEFALNNCKMFYTENMAQRRHALYAKTAEVLSSMIDTFGNAGCVENRDYNGRLSDVLISDFRRKGEGFDIVLENGRHVPMDTLPMVSLRKVLEAAGFTVDTLAYERTCKAMNRAAGLDAAAPVKDAKAQKREQRQLQKVADNLRNGAAVKSGHRMKIK